MAIKKSFIGKQAQSFLDAINTLPFLEGSFFIRMQQLHGDNTVNVDSLNIDFSDNTFTIKNTDSCYTTKKNTVLSVKTADCLPILISGTSKNNTPFIAAAHAGRKSTELNILYKLLEILDLEFNFVGKFKENSKKDSQKNTLNIWFGPAICEDCYQVDKKTDAHYNLISNNEKQILKFFNQNNLNPQKYLNLEIENACTLHEPKKYHSYRKTGPGVKMNYSFIEII